MEQYINKSALIAEIDRRKEKYITERLKAETINGKNILGARIAMLEEVLVLINTLEVKEVNLDNEYTDEIYSHLDSIKDTADRMTSGNFMHHRAAIKFSANTIAKVLELLGLKAQKGKEV